MRLIPIDATPNQSFSVRLNGSRYVLALRTVTGCMVADLDRDGVQVLRGVRLVAGEPVIPYAYLEDGNFMLTTVGDALPDWRQFGATQLLYYLTPDEIAALKAAPAAPADTWPAGSGYAQPVPVVLGVDGMLIYGRSVPGRSIAVTLAGVTYTPTVGPTGDWSFPYPYLVDGAYPVVARYTAPFSGPWSQPFAINFPTPLMSSLRAPLFGYGEGYVFDFVAGAALREGGGLPGYFGAVGAAPGFTFTRASAATRINAAGDMESVGPGVLRFDYDPVTLAPRGFLSEPADTEYCVNNGMQGAVPGAAFPSGWPTGWLYQGNLALVVGSGTENGIDYIDVRFVGTPSATANEQIYYQWAGGAAPGSPLTTGAFVSLVGGSLTNLRDKSIRLFTRNSGFGPIDGLSVDLPITAGALITKFVPGPIINAVGTGAVYHDARLDFGFTAGAAVDFTIRIGWPALRRRRTITSPIRTTAGTVTRAADVLTIPTSALPFNSSEGTLFVEAMRADAGTDTGYPAAALITNAGNRIQLYTETNQKLMCYAIAAEALQFNAQIGPVVAGQPWKAAVAYKSNDLALCMDGGAVVPDSTFVVPAMSTLAIGSVLGTGFNGWVRRVAYIPRRLANTALQATTS